MSQNFSISVKDEKVGSFQAVIDGMNKFGFSFSDYFTKLVIEEFETGNWLDRINKEAKLEVKK